VEELRKLKQAAIDDPTDAQHRWDLVKFYERNGFAPQAMIQLDVILRMQPTDEKANLEMASLLLATNQAKIAEKAYMEITRRNPKSAEGWQGLSASYFKDKDYLPATHAAEKAYALKPDDPDNKLALAVAELNYALQFNQPEAYAQQFEQARGLLTELTKIWPTSGEVYFLLGRTLRVMRRYPDAIPVLRRARELMPTDADTVTELARSLSASGDRATARKEVEAAIAAKAVNGNLYGIYAQLLQQSAEPDSEAKTVDALEHAVALAPHDTGFRERLGSAYLRSNRIEEARKLFEQIALADPNRSYPFQQLATIYSRMGQRERSAAAATQATKMAANENQLHQIQLLSAQHPESANLHLILGDRYMDLHIPGPAKDEYTQALKIDPKSTRAKNGLARLDALKNAKLTPDGQQPPPPVAPGKP